MTTHKFEIILVFKELFHQEGLSYTSPTTYYDKLGFFGVHANL